MKEKTSKYRGVSWHKRDGKWQAQIKVAGENENLGFFDDEEEAARAFDTRAAELGRPTNFDAAARALWAEEHGELEVRRDSLCPALQR